LRRQPGNGVERRRDNVDTDSLRGREEAPVHISRALHAHEIVLKEACMMAGQAAEAPRRRVPRTWWSVTSRSVPNEDVWFFGLKRSAEVPTVVVDPEDRRL
jgi:hypothetical protein